MILSVDSGVTRKGYRVKARNLETEEVLRIDIPEGSLKDQYVKDLQIGEWEKKKLFMRINIVHTGEEIKKATLIYAGLGESN